MKKYTHNVKIFFLYLVLVFSSVLTNAQTYTSNHAPIGGGGFVTGIVTHKTSGDRYCRTDVGGAYRWDATNSEWIQLLDWLNESESNFFAVESLALDPQNPNNIYMLCGNRDIDFGKTAILKSTDKGNTFTYTDVTAKFKTHGNGNGRGNGERLAVDPKNSNILFCGTRADGLWKSTDAGVTWNLAWNGVTTTPNQNGICFVLFDPSSSVVNGVSQTIYIGVSRTGGGNLYKSTNGGASFADISPTTSFMPHRVALQGTTMYVTYADGAGGDDTNGNGKLYKLNTSTGAWTNVTPVQSQDYSYGGVSVDPTNVNRVIVSTFNIYSNNQFGTGWGDYIFLSTDGGSTWTLKNGNNATFDNNGMGWHAGGLNWMDCIEFDQDNLSKVRVIGGRGIYTCSDITATNPLWKYDVVGLEETAFLDGISLPGGPFISALGDEGGFVHESLTSPPSSHSARLVGGTNNTSIAYAAGNPNKVVRISNGGNVVYYSTDKGATWTGAATNVGVQGKVDISADGGTILHCPWGSTTTSYTTNNGGSWSTCSGVSVENATPVADKVNSNYFYIHNLSGGQMLVSSNKGVSFSVAGTPGGTSTPWVQTYIRTVPGYEGHLWVPLVGNGLKYSTDHGSTYTTLTNVTYCKSIGIGKTMSGASYPTIFIWGTVSGVNGLFRSTDQGATWLRMNDDAHEFGGASLLVGDMNVEGRVYMGAAGARGIIYWDPDTASSGGGTGTILREYWTGISGTSISNLTSNANYPNNPSGNGQLTSLEAPTNWADNYGTRIRGYIHPTTSGSYTFWVAGDDNTEMYLSTDYNPANATRIAYVDDWTNSREWSKYSTQQSASVSLTAGQRYYVEVLHKDAFGGDNVAVAWQGPGITQQVIGGSYLSPYAPGSIVVRARGTQGGETIDLRVDGNTVATWTLTTSFADYTASGSGAVEVHFTNDNGARDVQVDYVVISDVTYQSENQAINTGVWQNSSCGGSNSEWLNCGGYISFATPESSSAKAVSTKSETLSDTDVVVTNDINMYPNPARQGRFTLVLPELAGNATINIFNYQGKMLYEKMTNGAGKLEIESGLKTGIYLVKVRTEKSIFTRKLIVH